MGRTWLGRVAWDLVFSESSHCISAPGNTLENWKGWRQTCYCFHNSSLATLEMIRISSMIRIPFVNLQTVASKGCCERVGLLGALSLGIER